MKKTTTESDKRGALNLKYRHVNTPNKFFLCLVLLFLLLMSAPVTHAETYTFVTAWGSPGTDNGSFASPAGVAVDSSGNIYVADMSNNRIQMFDSNGTFLTTWGSPGADNGSFASPAGVAVDSSGNIYVGDMSNNRIQKFDSNGTFLTTWGSSGADNGSFASPAGVAIDSSGNVYVADMSNNRIQKFDSNGTFLTTWGSSGADNGSFSSPQDVAVDPSGNVYVADYNNNRIQKFDSDGIFLTTWGSSGNDSGNFVSPAGIAADSTGNIYVSDSGNSRIQKFDSSGNFITTFGSSGSDNGSFSAPSDVAVDSSGNVYVADTANDRIQKFSILVFPVANFSSNVTSGYAPLSVEFTDSSENATGWSWDFGDGTSSTEQNITHTYHVAGNYTVNLTVSNLNGTDSIESIITVTDEPVLPVSNFSSNVSSGYAPLSVEFTDSSEYVDERIWDFGDGSNSIDQNPVHVFSTAGNFTVNLTVSNVNGTDSIESIITVTEEPVLPVANFSSNVTSGYAPLFVEFTDSSENATEWNWDFGDGSNSTDLNPVHVFSTAGNYTVNLTVNNVNGTDSIESTITVTDEPVLPVASFSSNVTSGYVPLTVEFTDSSENATSWFWDFGDGNNSTERNPVYIYSSVGNYTVNLTAINGNGTDSKTGDITVLEEDLILPVANFGSNVTSGYVPLSVQFNDSSENATGWTWFFGDENYTQAWSEVNSSAGWSGRSSPAAVSLPDGSIVIMGGNDNDGNLNDTWCSTDGGATWSEMNSSAGWSARSGHSAVSLPDGSIVIMGGSDNDGNLNDTWRSTDGGATWIEVTSSAGWSGRYSHSSVSLPDGSLIVMGGSDIDGDFNDVWRSTDGGATWSEVNSSAGWSGRLCPAAVSLSDGSIFIMGGTDGFTYFNDVWRSTDGGATWSEVNSSAGWSGRYSHSVVSLSDGSLVVMGGNDGTTNLNDTWRSTDGGATWSEVNSSAGWSARYLHSAVSLSDGSLVVLGGYNDTNLNDVWRFQLAGSTLQNPTHTYTSAGNYTVILTVSNADGYDTLSRAEHVSVLPALEPVFPVANFTSNVSSGSAPLSVQFTDLSENASSWTWDFGDGSNSTDLNPVHVFSTAGNFTVNLTVSNLNGTDSIESIITVTDEPVFPVANFSSNVTDGYAPLFVEFTDSSENADEWIWDFGDGSNSTEQNPAHVFSTAGNYTVNLTVSNEDGTDSIESVITVTEAPVLPVANFTSNVTSGFVPLSVQFNDSSENATAWSWNFGDGNSSADQNPLHVFSTAGTYTINLTASNVNGTDSKTANITVSDYIYAYCIEKNITDVSGNGSSANITKAGDIVSYQICVENKGNLNLTNVSVIDSFINLTGPVESLNTNDILEVGEHWHYTGNYTVTQEDLNNNGGGDGFINNTATVDCTELDEESDSVLVPIEQNPVCSIKKFVVDIAGNGPQGNISSAGDVIEFRVNMTNNGNIDLSNISVRDSLLNLSGPYGDIGLFGLYQSSPVQYPGGGDGILSVGETWYYLGNYTVTQEDLNNNGGGDGFLNSTVTLESSETGPINESTIQYIDESGNESGSVSPGIYIERNPGCSINKSVLEIVNGVNGTVDGAGDVIRYSILVTNEGNVELTGVSVSDPMITLTGPVESLSTDGVLELGENWTYAGNYTVTEDDMDNEGGGDEDIDNTATLSCNELSNKTSSVEVELIIPESSGGSSHSSGGSGGSPEPSTNIEVKEISQAFVTNGKAVQFDFTKNATCVVYVGFDSKKTAGKITTIAEQLKKKSTLVSNLTEGKVYKYFNVWVGNSGFVSSDNMENMTICFKVSKSWLQNENIDQDSITLNRYNNKIWVKLPVSLLKEDSKYLYFTADVPGYSFFAISGKSNASGGSVTEIKPDESEYVEENTGNNNVKPETTDEENTGESGSKFGILSLIAFLLIACLAVVFLYLRGQEDQK